MIECIDRIVEYIDGGETEFVASTLIQDGVVRNLEVIGEAAKRVPDDLRDSAPSVPWKKLAGLRDILIHQYEGVDLAQVWRIASDVLPPIREALAGLVSEEETS